MKRYAVYFAPRPGAFADLAAAWLGRDAVTGTALKQPLLPGLPAPEAITVDPHRYGFHGTIRAPFRLADGFDAKEVEAGVDEMAARLAPVHCDGLRLENLHGFLALTPEGCDVALQELAATVVAGTDAFRARLTAAEVARRRPQDLTTRQRAMLDRWGYPYVMEEFRFHLTLTDRLAEAQAEAAAPALRDHFAPVLPKPFVIEDLCLFGEDEAGDFHLLHRYALTG